MILDYVRDGWTVTIQYHNQYGKTIERKITVAFPNRASLTLTQEADIVAKEVGLAARAILREREE